MFERVHRKILRTIQDLPLRCPCKALQSIMGAPSIYIIALIQQRQLNFLHSFSILPSDSLPRLVFEKRLACPSSKGIIPSICLLIESLSLSSPSDIFRGDWSRHAWKRLVSSTVLATEYSSFLDSCDHLPLSSCPFRLGRPIPHWSVTQGLRQLTRNRGGSRIF